MSSVNKVILIGRLGKDPEIRALEGGNSVANFSLATGEIYKDKTTGDKKEYTEWHNLVLWNKLAEVSGKYLHKGDLIYVEGKNRTRSWEAEGVTRYRTEVVVNSLSMLSTKRASGPPTVSNSDTPPAGAINQSPDDLPF